jgi:hypothetical protein
MISLKTAQAGIEQCTWLMLLDKKRIQARAGDGWILVHS